jgi:hypothetical protein
MDHMLKRDELSGAVLNTDNSSLEAYKQARSQRDELNKLREENVSIKSELSEIKELLLKALNK